MGVLTWLPRDLREQLEALDPAASDDEVARPELDMVLARAREADHPTSVGKTSDRSSTDPGETVHLSTQQTRRTPRTTVALAVLAAVVLVAGLAIGATVLNQEHQQKSVSPTAPSSALYGVSWTDVVSRATVVFRPGRAHTSDGCSGRTQTVSVYRNHLRLGKQVGTGYACGGAAAAPPPRSPGYAEYERHQAALTRFYQVLGSAPAWSISRDVLTLTSPDDVSIRLTTKGSAPLTLPGSQWSLQEVTTLDLSGVSGGLAGPALTFDSHGGFRASDSCDVLSGTAGITSTTVAFRTVHRSHHDCAKSLKDQMITTIDTLLDGTVTYQVEDNTLRLDKPGTHGELVYIPAPKK